jgi:hypothetical protein
LEGVGGRGGRQRRSGHGVVVSVASQISGLRLVVMDAPYGAPSHGVEKTNVITCASHSQWQIGTDSAVWVSSPTSSFYKEYS